MHDRCYYVKTCLNFPDIFQIPVYPGHVKTLYVGPFWYDKNI